MASNISIRDIATSYLNLKQGPRRQGSANLSNVSVRIETCEGHGNANREDIIPRNTAPEVVIDNGREGPQLKTSQNLENFTKVVITSGTCQDLQDRKVDFTLPYGRGQVQIQLKPGEQVVHNDSVRVELHSSYGHGAKATAPTHREDVAPFFNCKVYPKGKILINEGTRSVKIQTAIRDLLSANSSSVKAFGEDSKGFFWNLEGFCVMRTGTMHSHNWSS